MKWSGKLSDDKTFDYRYEGANLCFLGRYCCNLGNSTFKSLKAEANLEWSNRKPKLNRKKVEIIETSLIKREIVDSEVREVAKGQVT